MIPKAEVLSAANDSGLFPTTVEKDYALGWVLFGIAGHDTLGSWVFKGGTCLKKCYFDTYRFSEDLDFTVRDGGVYSTAEIEAAIKEVCDWVAGESGIEFPAERLVVEELTNPRGKKTFQARISFVGPLRMPANQIQRIKFDISNDEVLVDSPEERFVFHPYSDTLPDISPISCYTLNEILAEKTRALHERSGRARDVFDVVNIARNFRDEVDRERTFEILEDKFRYKELPTPSTNLILSSVDSAMLATDWDHALGHQLAVLPPMEGFLSDLQGAVEWLFAEEEVPRLRDSIPGGAEEQTVERLRFAGAPVLGALGGGLAPGMASSSAYSTVMERIRFAARNRLLARVRYNGVDRIVEPYSLRVPGTGNLLLYVFEMERGGRRSENIKAFKVAQIAAAEVTSNPFQPRFMIEL